MAGIKLSIDLEYFDNLVGQSSRHRPVDESAFEDCCEFLFDALSRFGLAVDVFATGDVMSRRPDLIRRLINDGHRVGFHSSKHADFSSLTPDELRGEFECFAQLQTQFLGLSPLIRVPGFRMPRGSRRVVYDGLLEEFGVADRSSVAGLSFFGRCFRPGGTVFRILPLIGFRWLLASVSEAEIYIHPRDVYEKIYFPAGGTIIQKMVSSMSVGSPRSRFEALLADLVR